MNKILLIGRLVRDPETQQTNSGIKYSRFTIAVNRPYGENQVDYIPIIAWRAQSDFVERYMRKGSQLSIEGRFSSSTYQNADNQTVTRYEVAADRIGGLETKAQREIRNDMSHAKPKKDEQKMEPQTQTQAMKFEEEASAVSDSSLANENADVPWELDL